MSVKHSTGPFLTQREPFGEVTIWTRAPHAMTLATVHAEDHQSGELELPAFENALLFCAAPDLLAAAKRALTILKAQGESVRPGNVLGALDAAISKAEGRV